MVSFPRINICLLSLIMLQWCANAFIAHNSHRGSFTKSSLKMTEGEVFEKMVAIPPKEKGFVADMKIDSILPGPSELIEVRYALPFGLDVAPKDGLAVCTKDGTGGEKLGDVLRYTSAWTMGLPRGDGLMTTAASFSGGVSWQCFMFDIMKASKWEDVVEALTSNTDQRTNEVVLLFERPL